MTMTTLHAMSSTAESIPWSGIDAGRREQVGSVFTTMRYFRRSRRSVKRAPGSGTAGAWPGRLQLRGSHAYLRELRRREMEAWQQTGGDVYHPPHRPPLPMNREPVTPTFEAAAPVGKPALHNQRQRPQSVALPLPMNPPPAGAFAPGYAGPGVPAAPAAPSLSNPQ